MYRKVLTISFLFVVILLTIGYFVARNYDQKTTSTKITTSFFPLYVASSNILKDVPVELVSLYSNSAGCIHELNLSTEQIVDLNSSKIFIMNGAGMDDNILEKVSSNIKIVNASESIPLILTSHDPHSETKHSENESSSATHHPEYNSHYWLSITNYIQVVTNIKQALLSYEKLSPFYTQIDKNSSSYIEKLQQLRKDTQKKLATISSKKLYFLGDSFKYFVSDLQLHSTFIPFNFHEQNYVPSDLVNVIKIIRQEKIKVLFVSEDASEDLLSSLQKEASLSIYKLSLLNQPEDQTQTGLVILNSYINEYQKNIDTLVRAYNL